jgi:enterochelin esterase-like enzyme
MLKLNKILLICTVVSLCLAIVAVAQNPPAAGGPAGGMGRMGANPGGAAGAAATGRGEAAGRGAGRGARGGRGGGTVKSPQVNVDRTVTFRLNAPQATSVELSGEIVQGMGQQLMTKDSNGVWSITIGPLSPEIYIYTFRIGGVDFPDPANINIMPRSPGLPVSNFVEVPGNGPAFYDSRPVPHGQVRIVLYESKAMGVSRYMWVYTPPNYDKSTEKYPVFYLLHGNGETQEGWMTSGRANIIMDNLIADGKALPMIVVMTHGHALQSAYVGPYAEVQQTGGGGGMNFSLFSKEMLEQVIPTIEANFRVYADADHRAIGGLSMGGMQSTSIGLSNPDVFHYVLSFSGGFGGMGAGAAADPAAQSPWKELLTNPDETKKRLRLLFLGCGQQETGMLAPGQQLVKLFKEKGINAQWADFPGGHVFSVWRNHLNTCVPMLFK